ncbi:MAG: 4Fe-4S dicluster domain-containing protein [Reinekea forsetii]|nr:4Fe-4S dicluster domain-containing protein [Reinekea forsetii]
MMKQEQYLARKHLKELLTTLIEDGYQCIGPRVRDGAIVYAPLTSIDQLPWGVSDRQQPGGYKLSAPPASPAGLNAALQPVHPGQRAFDWSVPATSIKALLFAPSEPLWCARPDASGQLVFRQSLPEPERVALFGVRPCDLRAIAIQDRVFLAGPYADIRYQLRRSELFIIALNCTHSGDLCFCVGTGGSLNAERGYDLALTELDKGYLVQSGSKAGRSVLTRLNARPASSSQRKRAQAQQAEAYRQQQHRQPKLPSPAECLSLLNLPTHPEWAAVAERCLACANCTQACPTCFCHTVVNQSNLELSQSEHSRQWDSCFSDQHSYCAGQVVRATTEQRYRQWLSHKFASWQQQFGEFGCVGCGRCISCCPAGIDIIEVLNRLCHNKPELAKEAT